MYRNSDNPYPDTLRGQLQVACTVLEEKVADKLNYHKLPEEEQLAIVKSIQELNYIIKNHKEKWLD